MKEGKIGAVGLAGKSVFLQVDHFHHDGETLHAERLYAEPGGKAYNQAVAAARLGAQVRFIGAVGDDGDGRMCRDFLQGEKIQSNLQVCPECSTAYACILTDRSGENRVTVYSGAAGCLSAEYIRSCEPELAECSILLLGFECPWEATQQALQMAKTHRIMTVLNPAPARAIPEELLQSFDWITPNRQEASVLLHTETKDLKCLCRIMQDRRLPHAVVTLGGEGALLFDGGQGWLYPPVRCLAADTTGAGDCFNGALAAALLEGQNPGEAVNFAVHAASLSVRKPHVMTALPTRDQVMSQMTRLQPERIF